MKEISTFVLPMKTHSLNVTLSGKILVMNPFVLFERTPSPSKYFEEGLAKVSLSNGGGYGIPSAALMRAIQWASRCFFPPAFQAAVNMGIRIHPADAKKNLLHITARKGPYKKKDTVRIAHNPANNMRGIPSVVHRIAWRDWKIHCTVSYLGSLFTKETVTRVLEYAGRGGMLDGRRSKGSGLGWGTFTVKITRLRKATPEKRKRRLNGKTQKSSKEAKIRRA